MPTRWKDHLEDGLCLSEFLVRGRRDCFEGSRGERTSIANAAKDHRLSRVSVSGRHSRVPPLQKPSKAVACPQATKSSKRAPRTRRARSSASATAVYSGPGRGTAPRRIARSSNTLSRSALRAASRPATTSLSRSNWAPTAPSRSSRRCVKARRRSTSRSWSGRSRRDRCCRHLTPSGHAFPPRSRRLGV